MSAVRSRAVRGLVWQDIGFVLWGSFSRRLSLPFCRVALGTLYQTPFLPNHSSSTATGHKGPLLQSLLGKGGKDERGLVDLGVVVPAEFLLLLGAPRAQGHLDVGVGVLAADHEADLARRVRRDGRVGVLGHGEDLLAVLLELGDERKVEPLVLGCERYALAICSERKGVESKQEDVDMRKPTRQPPKEEIQHGGRGELRLGRSQEPTVGRESGSPVPRLRAHLPIVLSGPSDRPE